MICNKQLKMIRTMINRCNIAIVGIVSAMLLGFSSCAMDLSFENFPVNEVNDIRIEGLTYADGRPRTFQVAIGDTLRINPTLIFSLDPEGTPGRYTYRWSAIRDVEGIQTGDRGRVVWRDRNLVLPIEGFLTDPRERLTPFTMVFQVIDTETGIPREQRFFIQVRSRLQLGTWILHEGADEFDISIVSNFNDSLFMYRNVLYMFESPLPRTGKTPKALHLFTNLSAPNLLGRDLSLYSAFIHTDKSLNSVGINDFSFDPVRNSIWAWEQWGANLGENNPVPTRMIPAVGGSDANLNTGLVRVYVFHNDNLYFFGIDAPTVMNLMWLPLNRINVGTVAAPVWEMFTPAPFLVASRMNGGVLFDETNRRFVRLNGGGQMAFEASNTIMNTMRSWPLSDNPAIAGDHHFSWTNDIERLRYMGNHDANGGFAIIKCGVVNRYRYIQFRLEHTAMLGTTPSAVTKQDGQTFANTAFVERVRLWIRHPSQAVRYLFAVTYDNEVYRISLDMINIPTRVTSQILRPGYRISTMSFLSNGGMNHQPFVTVGSYNPAGPVGANGRVQMFHFETTTGTFHPMEHRQGGVLNDADDALIPMDFTGFGRPVDVQHRFR